MNAADITPSIFDQNALAGIKRQARSNDPAALKAAAQQFEALFLQMVLKSMRDATPKEGLFDNDQTRLYESLLDQQMSQVLAAKGGTGLAKIIESQLSQHAEPAGDTPAAPGTASFLEQMMPHAVEASRASGIPARFMVGQAALETGWGRAEPREGTEEHFRWQEQMDQVRGMAEIIIGKQRHGPIGTVKVSFNEDLTKFGNLARDHHHHYEEH